MNSSGLANSECSTVLQHIGVMHGWATAHAISVDQNSHFGVAKEIFGHVNHRISISIIKA